MFFKKKNLQYYKIYLKIKGLLPAIAKNLYLFVQKYIMNPISLLIYCGNRVLLL